MNGKALLLIDNCPAHPKNLQSDDGNIVVNQHVIAKIKIGYKERFLSTLFTARAATDFEASLKAFNLRDAFRCLSASWETVTPS